VKNKDASLITLEMEKKHQKSLYSTLLGTPRKVSGVELIFGGEKLSSIAIQQIRVHVASVLSVC
jgi:hypothetical protein